MRQSITINFESDAPAEVVERIADRMVTQLEYIGDPDTDFTDEQWAPGVYDVNNATVIVNGKQVAEIKYE